MCRVTGTRFFPVWVSNLILCLHKDTLDIIMKVCITHSSLQGVWFSCQNKCLLFTCFQSGIKILLYSKQDQPPSVWLILTQDFRNPFYHRNKYKQKRRNWDELILVWKLYWCQVNCLTSLRIQTQQGNYLHFLNVHIDKLFV